jgi:hypothetical protein
MSEQRGASPEVGAHDVIAFTALQSLLAVKGEGDAWDFKESLSLDGAARVELARDAMAFGNHRGGGSLIIGVTRDYEYPGLQEGTEVDTTKITNAIQKYVDGDFTVLAAEHQAVPPGSEEPKRFGLIHFGRRSRQPLIAAKDGVAVVGEKPSNFFRAGDIFVRRGAQSIRANSGDLRLLLEATAVDEARVQGVNRAWAAVVEVRALLVDLEFIYDILLIDEYPNALNDPRLSSGLQSMQEIALMNSVAELQKQVLLERPHLSDLLYGLFGVYSAFCGRLLYKAVHNRSMGQFLGWGRNADGSDDGALLELAQRIVPAATVDARWRERSGHRPVRGLLDEMEQVIMAEMRRVLSGWA